MKKHSSYQVQYYPWLQALQVDLGISKRRSKDQETEPQKSGRLLSGYLRWKEISSEWNIVILATACVCSLGACTFPLGRAGGGRTTALCAS